MTLKASMPWLCAAFLLAVEAGCSGSAKIQVSTAVRSDGSCDRTIVQPRKGYLPDVARPTSIDGAPPSDDALAPQWIARWKSVSGSPEPPAQPTLGAKLEAHTYFIAEGTFESPADIPPHYRYFNPARGAVGASELNRQFKRTDFGLFVEYQWTETVTNTVTLETFMSARDKLLDKLLPEFAAEVSHDLKRYDTSDLEAYIKTGCRPMLVEASLAYYEATANKLSHEELNDRLATIATRHGWTWPTGATDDVHSEKVINLLEELTRQVLIKYLKHRDGTGITVAEADAILKPTSELGQKSEPAPAIEEDPQTMAELSRLFGVYDWLYIFDGPEQFEFALELPGILIETNGLIVDTHRCLWRFTAMDTYPSGYRMAARSIAINLDNQQKLLGRAVVNDAREADRFIRLIGRDGALFLAVQQAFTDGKLDGLSNLKINNVADGKRLREVKKLFGLP